MDVGKIFGAFILGAAAGAVASWMLTKEKYKKLADEEIESVKEYYDKKYKSIESRIEKVKEHGEEIRSNQKKLNEAVVKYNTFSEPDPKATYNIAIREHPSEKDMSYEIDFDEYLNGEITNEKRELIYYAGDQTLVDEQGVPVEIDQCVGYDNIALLEDSTNDIMYFRNPKNETDYEVDKVEGSYKDLLGDI